MLGTENGDVALATSRGNRAHSNFGVAINRGRGVPELYPLPRFGIPLQLPAEPARPFVRAALAASRYMSTKQGLEAFSHSDSESTIYIVYACWRARFYRRAGRYLRHTSSSGSPITLWLTKQVGRERMPVVGEMALARVR